MQKISINKNYITFDLYENLTIKNLQFKNQQIIQSLIINDDFLDPRKFLINNYPYLKFPRNIWLNLVWDFQIQDKKKMTSIFAKATFRQDKLKLNLSVIINISKNMIIIKLMNNASEKILYGINATIIPDGKIIVDLPFFLPDNKGALQLEPENTISFRRKLVNMIWSSSLGACNFAKNKITFTPIIHDQPKRVFRAWSVAANNKNLNVIKLTFQDHSDK